MNHKIQLVTRYEALKDVVIARAVIALGAVEFGVEADIQPSSPAAPPGLRGSDPCGLS